MTPSRSAAPIVVGLLALAGAAPFGVARLSPVRRLDLAPESGRVSLEVPKSWLESEVQHLRESRGAHFLTGTLSGGIGFLMVGPVAPSATEAVDPPGGFLRDAWSEGRLRYSLHGQSAANDPKTPEWTYFTLTVADGARGLQVIFACEPTALERNRPLLERCARSVRWEPR